MVPLLTAEDTQNQPIAVTVSGFVSGGSSIGNGMVEVPLTPGRRLGELLRSGSPGPMPRDKIRTALASALDKANLQATIPAELQPVRRS